MIDLNQYLRDPCRVSSIPYWKACRIKIPQHIRILHDRAFLESEWPDHNDVCYFRLMHHMCILSSPVLPHGYELSDASITDYVRHIQSCYQDIGITEAEMEAYQKHPVYDSSLWLAIRDQQTGMIIASGIGELDLTIGEGILEWIQVSEAHRGRGLGRYIVSELLFRMTGRARFVTVSGQCNNPSRPEALYRRCGFEGQDVWHILRKK